MVTNVLLAEQAIFVMARVVVGFGSNEPLSTFYLSLPSTSFPIFNFS
jgi:hypothetical protein